MKCCLNCNHPIVKIKNTLNGEVNVVWKHKIGGNCCWIVTNKNKYDSYIDEHCKCNKPDGGEL